MPITIKPKKKVSSNKEETLDNGPATVTPPLPSSGPASTVSKLFIDRLSIVLDLDHQQVAHDAYGELMSDQDNKELLIDAGTGGKWKPFQWAKRVVIPSLVDHRKFPLLQCQIDKVAKTVERLRLDFVPIDLGATGMEELALSFAGWFDAGWAIIKKGTATRLDVAVDMPAGVMGQFHLLPHQGATTRLWGVNGELQTEPPRVSRRPFGLSYAAMAGSSSMA